MEQDAIWFESGKPFFVDIVLGADVRGLVLQRSQSWADLPAVTLTGAESETLPIEVRDSTIEIDASEYAGDGGLHRVRIMCIAPDVDHPTMASIRGKLDTENTRVFDRGVLVRPASSSLGPAG